jgi:hypothetical protein
VSSGCWPGVVLVTVREFEAQLAWVINARQYRLVLSRISSHMKGLAKWRLFGYEVVSGVMRRGRGKGSGGEEKGRGQR